MSVGGPLAAVKERLRAAPKRWLVTGCAGFIGSHLIEHLLAAGQHVTGLDNFATGSRRNLDEVLTRIGPGGADWRFIEGDIRDRAACSDACAQADVVLHQAALGSVPRSVADPLATHEVNATGFLNMLVAARDAAVSRFVYAASSAVYGDAPSLPKVEDTLGRPLSPYAVTKHLNELYAQSFSRCYGLRSIGLRYFNVFGPRQDPNGPYAAVIPRWIDALLKGQPCTVHGDGSASRDFCFIDNVVQANLLAAVVESDDALDEVYNVAVGQRHTLLALHAAMTEALQARVPGFVATAPLKGEPRAGDIAHSLADIGKARLLLGYVPSHTLHEGLAHTFDGRLHARGRPFGVNGP